MQRVREAAETAEGRKGPAQGSESCSRQGGETTAVIIVVGCCRSKWINQCQEDLQKSTVVYGKLTVCECRSSIDGIRGGGSPEGQA